MKIRHALLTSILPVVAFATTSCSGVATKINYKQAVEYASNNFDKYALDTVNANDVLNINSLAIAGKAKLTNMESGVKHTYDISAGIKGLTVSVPNVPAISVSSAVVSYIGAAYNDFASLFSVIADVNPTALDFYKISDGLTIDFTTNDKGRKAIDVIKILNSAMNMDRYAIPKLLGVPDANKGTAEGYAPDYSEWLSDKKTAKQKIGPVYSAVISMFGDTVGGLLWNVIIKSLVKSSADFIDAYLSNLIYKNCNVGIDDSSTSHNDKFNIIGRTNAKGFLTEVSFTFRTDVDLLASLVMKEWMGMSYVADVSLSIDLNMSLKSNIK